MEYDSINRSLIEIIPHPLYPPTPSEIFSEGDFYTGQTPPDSPEPIESILRRHEEPRLTPPYIFDPRDEDYMIDYHDLMTPPKKQGLTIKSIIRQGTTPRPILRQATTP